MKRKIVLWGNDENDKKILIALELKAEANKVAIHTFPEEIATELFYNEMMEKWRSGTEVTFPEGHTTLEKDLSVTESLLPETIKVTRGDIVNRASTEWHFVVLSTKLFEMYRSELEDKKEKIQQLTQFDNGLWNEMKDFWGKVQNQVFERNLLRNHADQLKDGTNKMFDQLKELKSALDKEFKEFSDKNKVQFESRLQDIEGKIEKGLGLKPLFEDLKKIQTDFRNSKFTREDRNKLWARIDDAFKQIKGKRFNDNGSGDNSPLGRLERRYNGLVSAITKMQKSINNDKKDIEFQNQKINTTDGQLEQQIRQAKLKMIEERISSKEEKLADMNKTKAELDKKMDKEKQKAKIEEAKVSAKKKIAATIQEKEGDLSVEDKSKLETAAEEIKSSTKSKNATKAKIVPVALPKDADDEKPSDAKEEKEAPAEKPAEAKEEKVVPAEKPAEAEEEKEAPVEKPAAAKEEEKPAEKADEVPVAKEAKEVEKDVVAEATEVKEETIDEVVEESEAIIQEASGLAANVEAKNEEVKETLDKVKEEESIAEQATGIMDGITESISEAVEDVIDTVKAVGIVATSKVDDIVDKVAEKMDLPSDEEE